MRNKRRLFLGLACAAMLVAFSRIMFPTAIPDGVASFSVGLMVGVLFPSRDRRDSKAPV